MSKGQGVQIYTKVKRALPQIALIVGGKMWLDSANKEEVICAEDLMQGYVEEMNKIEEEERPPCIRCSWQTQYFCLLSGLECKNFVFWVEHIR